MRLPIKLKYIPKNRGQKRKILNEGKILKDFNKIESNFIMDIFKWSIITQDDETSQEEDSLTYQEIYLHHKELWDKKADSVTRNRKHIEMDPHYFSDLYASVEIPKTNMKWLRRIL